MNLILQWLSNLVSTLPILSALLIVAAVNAKRPRRVHQFFMPVVAGVYIIVALVLLYRFNDVIQGILLALAELIPFFPATPSRAWLFIWENVLVITFFVVIKIALKPLFTLLFTKGQAFGETLVARVYEFVPEYDMWFVERRLGSVRSYFRVLYWGSVVVSLLLVTTALTFSTWSGFSTVAFPALAALLVGEIFFALDGLTRQEYDKEILGETESSRRIGNFGPLRAVLRQVFPDRVLSDGAHVTSKAALDSGHRLGELGRSSHDAEQLAGAFFARLRDEGLAIDVNLVDACVDLLRGSSVLINNPFYRDLTPYLSLPAYEALLQDQKCLVITGRDSLAEDMVSWIDGGLESITGVPELWHVELLGEVGRDDLDVGVLRFADVHNLDVLAANDEFLRKVGFVILAEPSRMMATGQLGLGLVLARCAFGDQPTFAAFDRNHDGLVDALSHLLKLSLTEVVASALPQGSSAEVVWQADGPHMHTGILPRISRYLGVGTEIGAVALKYHVSRVQWVGADKFPVTDMMWIAGQYYSQINTFADLELSQDALHSAIIPVANPWGLGQEQNNFLIVEDEIANVFETIRLFATRATENGFVNLISEDYLLRDYMVGNSDLFSSDPKAVPSFIADFARTERNAVLRMILALVTFGISDSELALEFELIGWTVPDGGQGGFGASTWESPMLTMLRRAIAEHTGVTEVPIRRTLRGDSDFLIDDAQLDYAYTIEPGSELDAVIDSLRAAYFFVEDEVGEVNRIGSLLFGHVYQALLPGQFVTHGGKFYEVQSISDVKFGNGVVLRRAAEHIHDRRVYRQLREFAITDLRTADSVASVVNVGDIKIIRSVATVEVQSLGYLELSSRSDVARGRRVSISGIEPRWYVNKAVLEIQLPDIPPRVRKTLTLLLNELFVTAFPNAYQYIVALTEDAEGEFGDLLSKTRLDEESNSIFIVEDSMIDLGLIVVVERYWQRFFEIITDYLAWNASPPPKKRTTESTPEAPTFPDRPEAARRRSWFGRMWGRLFGRRRRRSAEGGVESGPTPPSQPTAMGDAHGDPLPDESIAEVVDAEPVLTPGPSVGEVEEEGGSRGSQ